MNYGEYIRSELLLLIPVLNIVGAVLKKSRLPDPMDSLAAGRPWHPAVGGPGAFDDVGPHGAGDGGRRFYGGHAGHSACRGERVRPSALCAVSKENIKRFAA